MNNGNKKLNLAKVTGTITAIGIFTTLCYLSSMGLDNAKADYDTDTVYDTIEDIESSETEYNSVSVYSDYVSMPVPDGGTVELDRDVYDYIINISNEYNVPSELTFAVCYGESTFRPSVYAYNTDGSCDGGMMGISSTYIDYYSEIYNNGEPIDIYDYRDNIKIGTAILSDLYSSFDEDIYATACAYNMGEYGYRDYVYNYGYSYYYGDRVTNYINCLNN